MPAFNPPADDDAVRAARRVVEALRASDLRRAFDIADAALRQGLRHPALYNARALWWEARGEIENALADFEQTRMLVPNDAQLSIAIGRCLLNLERLSEASDAFDTAIAIKPDLASAYRYKADALAALGDASGAFKAYEKAAALDPRDALAFASLSALASRQRDTPRAKFFAEQSLALAPGNPAAVCALATTEVVERQFESAERRLRAFLAGNPDPSERAAALRILGDALDGQSKTAEAFAAYAAGKAELHKLYAARFSQGRAIDAANALIAYFETMPAERWAPRADPPRKAADPREHVFLLGFMRSGTTLLEQVLASHPDVVAMDEHDFLRDANEAFLTSTAGIERLADLADDEAEEWRGRYWKSIREMGIEPADKVFIDKLPFNTVKLPIIARLFPRARILFCLRDPRDVVFSSFRRPFEVNATIFEFLTLEDGARFYSAIMRLAGIYRSKLPLAWHEHRYETMVENFKETVSAVCDFLGIGWTEAMHAFSETAKSADIRNPSAAQVRQPLYSEGIGQWRRYRDQIAPVAPILAPWIGEFGYPPE